MSKTIKLLSIFAVLTLLALAFATPARAFDSREGDTVIIAKGEVIEDDLYVFANTIVLDGTVKGDLIAFGETISINGVVEGDLMTAGQTIIVTGEVKDDARIAGAALQIGSSAVIGDDLIAAGASLEMQKGSQVGGDLVVGSGQVLIAGDVAEDVLAGTAAFELRGSVGGDVKAYVDATSDTQGEPMDIYIAQSPISIPSISSGLNISPNAKIAGNLEYTGTIELSIPSGVVGGKTTRTEPKLDHATIVVQPTNSQRIGAWALNMLRGMLTLILFGLFIGWLLPKFKQALPEQLRAKPWASLGWGAVAWMAFFFALPGIVLMFAFLILFGLGWNIFWLGFLTLSVLCISFIIVILYLTKVIVSETLGKWLVKLFNPALAEHKVWPMILGVIVIMFFVELVRFPLLPFGSISWLLIQFTMILFGLGALWLWGRERFVKKVSNQ